MFFLAELKDTVRILPNKFKNNLHESIKDLINKKLANKVLLNIGLCITLDKLICLKDSTILPGDGSAHTEINFRFVVFRAKAGDIHTGKIRSCTREGVHVTLGFFDDIFVPCTALQHPSRFDEAEQAWVWEYPLDSGESHDLYMDIGESVKFRVSENIFTEISPIKPEKVEHLKTNAEAKISYKIMAVINESGLGVLSWWDSNILSEIDNGTHEMKAN